MRPDEAYLSEKMTRYVLDMNSVAVGTGFSTEKAVINPSIAHAICVKSVGGHREPDSRTTSAPCFRWIRP